ncbi:MAG: bifunctional folylpolyglutamate synthase/dihydrofolate synthase [Planctomycetota bacterium]
MTRKTKATGGLVPTRPPSKISELSGYLAAFTNYEQQQAPSKGQKRLGPERAAHLLAKLGLTPVDVPVIQVAGSKGKGSTVLWMEALLLVRGKRPGAYMSPHLERINERIRIGGEEVSDADILKALRVIHESVVEIEQSDPSLVPTFFDLWTCVAVYLFRQAKITHMLLEVGLGGPQDSTSAVPHQIGVLTSIDLEHRRELGDTLDEIAREKARIARSQRPFIIAEFRESWGQTAARQAREQGAEILAAPIDHRVPSRLEAPQDRNLAVALASLEALPKFEPFTESETMAAIEAVQLTGRLESLVGPPPLLLDAAHTRRSMEYFQRRFVSWRGARPGAVLIGLLEGKEWRACLEVFAQDGNTIDWIVTTPEPKRRLDPAPLVAYLKTLGGQVFLEEDVTKAAQQLRELARRGAAIGVTGSFYLAGKVRELWMK